jgi:DNA polymerase III subunit delta
MTVLREQQVPQFLRRELLQARVVLVNGTDTAAVSDIVREIAAAFAKLNRNDVTHARFDASELKSDRARLTDELQSQSLFGGAKLVTVSGCDDSVLKVVQAAIAPESGGSLLLLEADALPKSSKLKQAAEELAGFYCLTLYEAEEGDMKLLLRKRLSDAGLQWAPEAEQQFFDLVGVARGVVSREVEKLILFCAGRSIVTADDVSAVCGDAAEFLPDEAIDAALAGDFESSERILASLDVADVQGVLAQLLFHLQRLQAMRYDMGNGATADSAVKRSKPPVFFKRQRAVVQQLSGFDAEALEECVVATASAIATVRTRPALAASLTHRHFLWLAGQARRRR